MGFRFPVRGILLASVLILPSAADSEVIHGFQTLHPTWMLWFQWDEALDFATQTVVSLQSENADLAYAEHANLEFYDVFAESGSGLRKVTGTLEELQTAPAIAGNNFVEVAAVNVVYVTQTGDGQYVKFAIRSLDDGGCCSMLVEYYVQTDGSPSFGPLLATQPASWGRIKALYR